jgi:biotin transport system substrate-specific component
MTTAVVRKPLVDLVFPRSLLTDIALVMTGTALISLAAQVKVMTLPVPLTLQTFAVLLVAASLGMWRGVAATSAYLAIGALGLPVFSGAQTLAGAIHTTGYLIGFIVASALIGWFADQGAFSKVRNTVFVFTFASVLIYALGVAGLMLSPLQLTIEQALSGGVLPFLWFDAVKAAAAAAMLPFAIRFAGRS